jgi:translation elongation factor EF-4
MLRLSAQCYGTGTIVRNYLKNLHRKEWKARKNVETLGQIELPKQVILKLNSFK